MQPSCSLADHEAELLQRRMCLANDPSATVAQLLETLSITEKASIMTGVGMWENASLPRVGLRSLRMSDGPHGVRGLNLADREGCASFPCEAAMGATFDEELIFRIGEQLGDQARRKSVDILLAPTMNLQRIPNSGRHFECFSEDTFVTARLGVAYVRGVQSRGVGCVAKHFVGNDQEHNRAVTSSEIPITALRELYLAPFEAVVREANVLGIMTGYNRLFGIHCAEHNWLLKDVLREEWGFNGFVVSDWYGNVSTAPACHAGLNLEMPGLQPLHYGSRLVKAASSEAIPMDVLNKSCEPILSTMVRFNNMPPSDVNSTPSPLSDTVKSICHEAAVESCVLLKNDGPTPLPFSITDSVVKELGRPPVVAVLGISAYLSAAQGGGSSRVTPAGKIENILDAIKVACCTRGAEVIYEEGHRWNPPHSQPCLLGLDRGGLQLNTSHTMRGFLDFTTGVYAGITRNSVLGPMVRPLANSIMGLAFRPSPPIKFEENPSIREKEIELNRPCIEKAALAAEISDFTVVVVGTDGLVETEGDDMNSIRLPGLQDELIMAVAKAREGRGNWAVVLNCGSPKDISSWIHLAPCVLQARFGGQEMGRAIADIIFGGREPGGRLPQTWPHRLADCEPIRAAESASAGTSDQERGANSQHTTIYHEGLLLGYLALGGPDGPPEPLFSFGHGLSYAGRFEYSGLQVDKCNIDTQLHISVNVTVTNPGSCAGSEVVQLYIRSCTSLEESFARPAVARLRGFQKLHMISPGKSIVVTFRLNARDFAHWQQASPKASDEDACWTVYAGNVDIAVGSSSSDIRCRNTLPFTQTEADLLSKEARM